LGELDVVVLVNGLLDEWHVPLDLVYEHGATQRSDEPLGVRESGFACR
jgi:hypothetical protein